MEQPVSHATILTIEHFPPFSKNSVRTANPVSGYLEKLVQNNLNRQVNYLELPSMSRLSGFFGCSFLDVYDAFLALRDKGFDYQFSSVDGAMMVWRQAKSIRKGVMKS